MLSGAFIVLVLQHAFAQGTPDTDGDGWSDGYEIHIGTSPTSRCTPAGDTLDAFPPDLNHDGLVDIFDIVREAQWFAVDANNVPYLYRFDLYPEPMGDGVIDILDISRVTDRFAT